MRAVVDVNVLISAALSPHGAPARLLRAWLEGHFEMVVSPLLLQELERALGYPKIRDRIDQSDGDELLRLIRESALIREDADQRPPVRGPDPDDDYLITLAHAEGVPLVTGDAGLLSLAEQIPVRRAYELLAMLGLSG